MKYTARKVLAVVLLAGWCLLFLRCESTEKSMVRAVYLAQNSEGYCVGLLYQAPEASADASEASAALQFVQAQEAVLEKAFAAAEQLLPQQASYRLCDYLLLQPEASEPLLEEYEQLLLRRPCGRTAAKLVCAEGDSAQLESTSALPDAIMDALKKASAAMPRLYQHREAILLPGIQWQQEDAGMLPGGVLHTIYANYTLDAAQAETFRLLTGIGGSHSFWLEGEQISIRRCTVSVTVQAGLVHLRLDCQRQYQSPQPTDAQRAQLSALCTALVQDCWQQGIDLLHLAPRAALYHGTAEGFDPTKNACPQVQTDVRFLSF